jgi:hypothetical protein
MRVVFVFLAIVLVSFELKSQLIDENLKIEKAKYFFQLNKFDSTLYFLYQVSNKKFLSSKNIILLQTYIKLNDKKNIIEFFSQNKFSKNDFEFYYEIIKEIEIEKNILKNSQLIDNLNSFVMSSQFEKLLIELNYIDQLVRNQKEIFREKDADNEIDKYTFGVFYSFFNKYKNNIDTSRLYELDLLIIHWSQIEWDRRDDVTKLIDSLFQYNLILPNSYSRAKEILFYKKYKLSYYGLQGINSLLGLPQNSKINIYEPIFLNERRRRVGLIEL